MIFRVCIKLCVKFISVQGHPALASTKSRKRLVMKIRQFLPLLFIMLLLPACATASRGAKQNFVVETSPPGASVETTLLQGRKIRFSQKQFDQIKSGQRPEPKLEFLSCEPTPCSIDIPRKQNFDILVSRDGFTPEVITIDYFHRKQIAAEIEKERKRTTAIAGTGAAIVGAGTMALGVQAASLGTMSASGGAIAAGAAAFAAPVVAVGFISYGVDASTGANYDYWPNPVHLTLEATGEGVQPESDEIISTFMSRRRNYYIRPYPSASERKAELERIEKARLHRLHNDNLFRDFTREEHRLERKPQSQRRQRREEHNRERQFEEEDKTPTGGEEGSNTHP